MQNTETQAVYTRYDACGVRALANYEMEKFDKAQTKLLFTRPDNGISPFIYFIYIYAVDRNGYLIIVCVERRKFFFILLTYSSHHSTFSRQYIRSSYTLCRIKIVDKRDKKLFQWNKVRAGMHTMSLIKCCTESSFFAYNQKKIVLDS